MNLEIGKTYVDATGKRFTVEEVCAERQAYNFWVTRQGIGFWFDWRGNEESGRAGPLVAEVTETATATPGVCTICGHPVHPKFGCMNCGYVPIGDDSKKMPEDVRRKMESMPAFQKSTPPVGLQPERIWKHNRIVAIGRAICRYAAHAKQIPVEWVDELRELTAPPVKPEASSKAVSVLESQQASGDGDCQRDKRTEMGPTQRQIGRWSGHTLEWFDAAGRRYTCETLKGVRGVDVGVRFELDNCGAIDEESITPILASERTRNDDQAEHAV